MFHPPFQLPQTAGLWPEGVPAADEDGGIEGLPWEQLRHRRNQRDQMVCFYKSGRTPWLIRGICSSVRLPGHLADHHGRLGT